MGRALLPDLERRVLDAATRHLLPPHTGESPSHAPEMAPGPTWDFDVDAQLELLSRFEAHRLQEVFESLRRDAAINPPRAPSRVDPTLVIQNGFYPTPDAEIYAGLILLEKPERIIEIGSGFSTAVARAAVNAGALSTQIHVIDPEPRRSVEEVADRIEYSPVEHSSLVDEGVPPGTLLFIDSSHVTRSGGDGPFLYGSLLPRVAEGVLVQVHDIFLPFDYPRVYVERLYTEQHLLDALLANSTKFRPVLTTYLLSRRHPLEMKRAFGDAVAEEGLQGASFWMRSSA